MSRGWIQQAMVDVEGHLHRAKHRLNSVETMPWAWRRRHYLAHVDELRQRNGPGDLARAEFLRLIVDALAAHHMGHRAGPVAEAIGPLGHLGETCPGVPVEKGAA